MLDFEGLLKSIEVEFSLLLISLTLYALFLKSMDIQRLFSFAFKSSSPSTTL